MKFLSLLCFFLLSVVTTGQNKKTISVKLQKTYDVNLDETVYVGTDIVLGVNNIPKVIFQESKNEGGQLLQFKHEVIKQKALSSSERLHALNEIPLNVNLEVFIVKEVNKDFLTIAFDPIYKNNLGQVFQIEEIEVEYRLGNNQDSKITKTNRVRTVTESNLNSGTWYKIAVENTGVHKIDYNFLKSLGMDVDGIDPKKIRILGYGGQVLPEDLSVERTEGLVENAIKVIGEDDHVFNRDDVVLFYGQGTISWDIVNRTNITHKQNIYSKYGYYFISADSNLDGKRIETLASPIETSTKTVATFTDFKLHEEELFNYVRIGRQWFGEDFTSNSNQTFSFNFPNIETTTNVNMSCVFSSNSKQRSPNFSVNYNGSQLVNQSVPLTGSKDGFNTGVSNRSFLPNNDLISLDVVYNSNGDNSAEARLDYIKVIADRLLKSDGNQFGFVNFESLTNNEVLEYLIEGSDKIDYVWNVTDSYNVKSILNESITGSVFKFKEKTDSNLDKYHLVTVSDAHIPISLGSNSRIANQNILELDNVQYIIITNNELISQANLLKNYHEKNTFLDDSKTAYINVEVVDVQKIYNEFGSGNSDVTAIRNFIKYIYDKNSLNEDRLKYVCMLGDATFDYRNIQTQSSNSIPTYMSPSNSSNLQTSYNTDDYYGYMDEAGEISPFSTSWKLDLVTGRIPVSNSNEANIVIGKILNYYSSNSYGNWKNQITLLGDDGQHGDNQGLIKHLNNSANKITGYTNGLGDYIEGNNENLNVVKLYADAFEEEVTSGGESYPEVKKRFLEAFDKGSLVINYFGHGNVAGLGEENFLDISDIRKIRNLNNLPLFITVTCDFSRFDDPLRVSGGEELMLNSLGGAVSMVTTTRQIGITTGATVNNNLSDYLYEFDDKKRTIAEALKDTKNVMSARDKFFVFYFGDPLMNLSIPENNIKINKAEKYKVNEHAEIELEAVSTLKALSRHKLTGEIVDDSNNKVTSFNGEVEVVIYGAELARSTRLNEEGGTTDTSNPEVVNYTSLENKLFVGTASVSNGNFSFDLVLPKDIGFIEEKTKFSMYASSEDNEATGFDTSLLVGGIDPDVEEDNVPPVLELFMEDQSFIDGGETTSTPTFIANIKDESGINTTLNSIGHNLSLVIDGDLNNPINLNDFYTTEPDDFTQGIVSYELESLEVGNHTLTFKAWDTHNNSNSQTLNFSVVEDGVFKISKVLNYPNPFINYTQFWFSNNREGNPLEIKVQVYTVSGKLVKSILATDSNGTGTVRSLNWDGKDDFGNKLAKGVYLYKLTVKETTTGETDEKIEKLVIL